jgi:hypothetical protein
MMDEIRNDQNRLDHNIVVPNSSTHPSWVDKAASSIYQAGKSALQDPYFDGGLTSALAIGTLASVGREEIVPLVESLAESTSNLLKDADAGKISPFGEPPVGGTSFAAPSLKGLEPRSYPWLTQDPWKTSELAEEKIDGTATAEQPTKGSGVTDTSVAKNGSKTLIGGPSEIADLRLIDFGEPKTRTIIDQTKYDALNTLPELSIHRPSLVPEVSGIAEPSPGFLVTRSRSEGLAGQNGGFH